MRRDPAALAAVLVALCASPLAGCGEQDPQPISWVHWRQYDPTHVDVLLSPPDDEDRTYQATATTRADTAVVSVTFRGPSPVDTGVADLVERTMCLRIALPRPAALRTMAQHPDRGARPGVRPEPDEFSPTVTCVTTPVGK